MKLDWIKNQIGGWCPLLNLNLESSHFDNMEGVYIVWQAQGPIIRVGQGIIKERLSDHRNNSQIIAYKNLYVTWAKVDENNRNGIEKFLAETLSPKVGEAFPDCLPISVNLPWPR